MPADNTDPNAQIDQYLADLNGATTDPTAAAGDSVSSPSSGGFWSGLGSLVGLGANTYATVVNADTAQQRATAANQAALLAAQAKANNASTLTAYLPMLLAAAAGVLVLVLFLKRKG